MKSSEDLAEPIEAEEPRILADDIAGTELLDLFARGEPVLADDIAGTELLDLFARELGYDDLVIVNRRLCELPKQFAKKSKLSRWYALRTRASYVLEPVVAMDGCALGCGLGARYATRYADAARDVHRRLKNGGWLMADGKKFKAEDVPEFMMKCVLNGIA